MDRYFYSVEIDKNGKKYIYMSGNVYYNDADETDKCFRYAEWVGMSMLIKELKGLLENGQFFDYINERIKYLEDLTEDEAVDMCQVYFNGEPGIRKHIRSVNEDTPCGDYWFE